MSATVRVRGVVEGFYGPPYSFEQRRDLLRFLGRAGLNTYLYAPKLDAFHRDRWRDPYPAEYLDHFRDLVAVGDDAGVRFVYALSPGLSFDPAAGDVAVAGDKLRALFDVGVRDFCLLFDDIQADQPGADPVVQVDLVNAMQALLRALDPATRLSFISNYYAGTAGEFAEDRSPFARLFATPSSAYFSAYASIPSEIPILWTGPAVFSHQLTVADATAMRAYVGRPLWVWDNYPVNDALVARELFLGPYQGREADLGTAVDGVLLNPMLQPEATKIPLWTAGRYFAEGEGYDPWRAWEEALAVVTDGQGTDAVRTLARQFQSHPFIGDDEESPDFAVAAADFWNARTPAAEATLRALLTELASNRAALEAQLTNRALLDELLEPATKVSLFGEAGLLALDLLARKRDGQAVDVTPLQQRLDAASTIPWLVGANTRIPPALASLVGSRDAKPADVFGDFFTRARAELGA